MTIHGYTDRSEISIFRIGCAINIEVVTSSERQARKAHSCIISIRLCSIIKVTLENILFNRCVIIPNILGAPSYTPVVKGFGGCAIPDYQIPTSVSSGSHIIPCCSWHLIDTIRVKGTALITKVHADCTFRRHQYPVGIIIISSI